MEPTHPEGEQEPLYDAVTLGPMSAILGLSPFIGAALGIYLFRRGPDDLLFSIEMLREFEWLALWPIGRLIVRDPAPLLIELLLVGNVYSFLLLVVGLPFALAPRPIISRRYRGQYGSMIVKGIFLVFFFFGGRLFCIWLTSEMLNGRPPPKGGGAFGIVTLIPFSVYISIFLLSMVTWIAAIVRNRTD